MIGKKGLDIARKWAVEEARAAGKTGGESLVEVADAALVEAGRRAEARIQKRARNRTVKRALKTAGKAALVAGAAAAAVVAARRATQRDGTAKPRPRRKAAKARGRGA